MKLELVRVDKRENCTLGVFKIDGEQQCVTLEDVVRPEGEKVYGQTAIPYGNYRVIISYSNHFQRELPLLVDVPNFAGVRIHPGNTAADTEGCLLLGSDYDGDTIVRSRVAFEAAYEKILAAYHAGEELTLEIKDAEAAEEDKAPGE